MFQGPRQGFRPPYPGGMPPGPFMGPMQGRGQMGQMGSMMRGAAPARGGAQGGGLLSKLLGGGQTRGMGAAAASRAVGSTGTGSGLLQTLTNPGSINGFLTNTQKMLQTANQIGPMVQQYGPMVKNLPAMWKLYRGLKDLPDAEAAEDQPEKKEKKKPSAPAKAVQVKEKEQPFESTQTIRKEKASMPKLYI